MKREELIAYDRWLTKRKWCSGEIISPEKAADLYLAEHPLPPAEGAEEILHRHIDKQSMDELSVNVWPDMLEAMHEFAAQQQPTAEGAVPDNAAEQNKRMREWFKERTGLDDTLLSIHMKQIDVMLKGVQPQPTAEGAEEIRREYSEESLDFFRSFIKARKELCAISPTETYSLEEAIRKAFDGFFPKPLSIVNDAETILNSHPYLKVWVETLFDSEMKVCSIEQAIWAIERAATLHAQRLAEKMAEEKLKKEYERGIEDGKIIGEHGSVSYIE